MLPGWLLPWKSKRELTNGGLSPKFPEKIGGKSALEHRAFSAFPGPLFGAGRDQFLCTSQLRGKSRNCSARALFGPIGAFRAKAPFAKPPFGFPRVTHDKAAHRAAHEGLEKHPEMSTMCSQDSRVLLAHHGRRKRQHLGTGRVDPVVRESANRALVIVF